MATLHTDVLVVGAGLAGALLALELARHGIATVVLDRSSSSAAPGRAYSVGPHATALLRRFDAPDGRLTPSLRAAVQREPLATLRTGWTCTGLEVTGDHVRAGILEAQTRCRHVVTARYVAGCDGAHSTVRHSAGIPMDVAGPADPEAWIRFRCPALDAHLANGTPPAVGGVALEFRPDDACWVGHLRLRAGPGVVTDPAALLRQRLGVPVATDDVLDMAEWDGSRPVASTYRAGPVFLVGGAAHPAPPVRRTADLTIGDALDLGWKLAAVLAGWGGAGLLDSYQTDRHLEAALAREPDPPLRGVIGGWVPALRLGDGSLLTDRLGPAFTLVDLGAGTGDLPNPLAMPLTVLTGSAPAGSVWRDRLLLIRPDHRVAWCGTAPPADWTVLLDLAAGHKTT